MKILQPITTAQLPHPGIRAFTVSNSNHGTVARSKHAHKSPRSTIAPATQVTLFGQQWAKWRRNWLALIAGIWKHSITPEDYIWWVNQSALVTFMNYQHVTARKRPFYFFMWYQTRWFDLHTDRYIPFPNNAADFPHKYGEPWAPPTLEPPTIVSASLPGVVVVRCLNVAPDGTPLEPVAWFARHPPADGNPPIGVHPWYWTSKTDDDVHSEYTYELDIPFPLIKRATYASLLHCYCLKGNPYVGIERDPSIADDIPTTPTFTWILPNNALALDNVYTKAIYPLGPGATDKLALTGLSNPVPANATILGIAVAIWRRDQTLGSFDLHCCLTYGGGLETTSDYNPNQWTYSREYVQFGSDSELWGRTWTPAELNAADFGVHLWEEFSSGPGGEPEIDWATIFVYYSLLGDTFTAQTQTHFEFT